MPTQGTVSVIVPTLNRPSVRGAVASALVQEHATEILVIDDSPAQDLKPVSSDSRVRIIRTGGAVGSAQARNLGMEEAQGEFVAFLDDDDLWFEDHLSSAVSSLGEHPEHDIYCSRAFVRSLRGCGRVEPVNLMGDRSLWDYTYGLSSCWARGRRIITPTLVFRAILRNHPMDTDLSWGEDTWWLLTAERLGHRILQDTRVGAIVQTSHGRRRDRELDNRHLLWALRLEECQPGTGAMHLAALARTAAKEGRAREVALRACEARTLPRSARVMPIFAAELTLAAAVGALHRTRLHWKRSPTSRSDV